MPFGQMYVPIRFTLPVSHQVLRATHDSFRENIMPLNAFMDNSQQPKTRRLLYLISTLRGQSKNARGKQHTPPSGIGATEPSSASPCDASSELGGLLLL